MVRIRMGISKLCKEFLEGQFQPIDMKPSQVVLCFTELKSSKVYSSTTNS